MGHIRITAALIIAALVLAGCGTKARDAEDPGKTNTDQGTGKTSGGNADVKEGTGTGEEGIIKDYPFVYGGVTIHMNTDAAPVLIALGEPLEYFEAESCAFKGLDKTYFYSGIELTTYPKDADTDYISSVNFKDDSVSTPEGIYIGSSLSDMLTAYGEDNTVSGNSYTYTLGNSSMVFVVEDDEVAAITYLAVVEELQ